VEPKTSRLPRASVKLRRASLRELDVLVRQRRSMWEDIGERSRAKLVEESRIYRTWVRTKLKTGRVVGWVAETNRGDIVAGGIVWLRPTVSRPGAKHLAQPFLLSMYTEPNWRGQGLASKIVDEAVKWAKSSGYAEIRLHASTKGRGVYTRRGFRRTWEMKLKL
jgi:GNAT superfamily N-acetyltransferase